MGKKTKNPKEQKKAVKSDYRDERWEMKFYQLKEFKKKFGHFVISVKNRKSPYYSIGKWCNEQRLVKRHTPLKYNPDREQKLNKIGFQWNPKDAVFEKRFAELVAYKKKYGNLSLNAEKYGALTHWAIAQRKHKNRFPSRYDPEKVRRLNEIGFSWNPVNELVEERFTELVAFKEKHGYCNVPYSNGKLGKWVQKQRHLRNNLPSRLYDPEKERRLNEMGFSWHPMNELFEKRFAELVVFKKKYGHCNVPFESNALGSWVGSQRHYRNSSSSQYDPEKERRLNKIGFSWNFNYEAFEQSFAELVAFKKKHGHCNVPMNGGKLYSFVKHLRELRKKSPSDYDPEKERRLNEIGFPWNPSDVSFDRWLMKLKEYYKIHGHYSVTESEDKKLAGWCSRIRLLRQRDKPGRTLTPDRIKRLDAIKFDWKTSRYTYDNLWNKGFLELLAYKEKFGNFNVNSSANATLAAWARRQRKFYANKSREMTPEKIKKLEAIGFNLNATIKHHRNWNTITDKELFDELRKLQTNLHKTPTTRDVNEFGKYLYEIYRTRFGGIVNALDLAGLPRK